MSRRQKRIRKEFRKMEETRQDLINWARQLPEELLTKSPGNGQWSISQVLNHLFLSEQLSHAYLQKKLSYPDTVPPYHFRTWTASTLLWISLNSPYKVKAPPAINMWNQQDELPLAELDTAWSGKRQDLLSFLLTHEPEFGSHLVYNHPFAGRMTMTHMLKFFNDHAKHHFRQARRIHRKLVKK